MKLLPSGVKISLWQRWLLYFISYVAWSCVPRISVIIRKIKGRNEDDFSQYILEINEVTNLVFLSNDSCTNLRVLYLLICLSYTRMHCWINIQQSKLLAIKYCNLLVGHESLFWWDTCSYKSIFFFISMYFFPSIFVLHEVFCNYC